MKVILHKMHVIGLSLILFLFLGISRTWTWLFTILLNIVDGLNINSSKWGD